ncbi:F-box/kelch-repeat protein At3g06240-like [Quercus suber]|uniref:F-box/kelch-repeat protein At3g06240-like n=1 Tax=Quercus suber TaxID=58331 RepID=UPI000CE202B7|nr:F-box/kelch-repeat protein At3g06240-like [Quercus suber]
MVARDSNMFNGISEYPIPSALHLSSLRIVGSCNGLVCLAQYGYGSLIADAIYLWNPSIRKYRRLPDFSLTQYHWVSTGFAYQSETNDYKVVKITKMGAQNHHGVEVYTLSSNSWRRVEMSLGNNVAFNSGNCWPATFVNKALHWLGEVKGGVQLANRDLILSFGVNNDIWRDSTP